MGHILQTLHNADPRAMLIIIALISIFIIFFISPIVRFYVNADLNAVIHYGPADEIFPLEICALLLELHGVILIAISITLTMFFFKYRFLR